MTLESLMSGLIGSVIGGLITWLVARQGIVRAEAFAKASEEQECTNLLQAINDELACVYARYRESFAPKVEELAPGTALLAMYPVFADYFTVYNGNASRIGAISEHELRRAIIRTYTLSKGLVDSFRMNNQMIAEYQRAVELAAETQNAAHVGLVHNLAASLIDYGSAIKDMHFQALDEHQRLIAMLAKHGVRTSAE